MLDRPLISSFDWLLLLLIAALATVGISTLYSAITAGGAVGHGGLHLKQGLWYLMGLLVMAVCCGVPTKTIDQHALLIYLACLLPLGLVLVFGRKIGGAQRWLSLGPLSLQPSEVIKVAVIVMLAHYYSQHVSTEGLSFRELFQPAVIIALPVGLIALQPDLGTAMVVVLIAVSMTLFVKIRRQTLMILFSTGLAAAPVFWLSLKPYQLARIKTFLNPESEPLGAGYHILQSTIAIGSGMLQGKGFAKGTQNALSFLPEQHTDFIFSVLAEEWGFIGAATVLTLFLLTILRGFNIAYHCRNPFGTVLAIGVTALVFWETFINIGMVMGLMPVVGVPLPFISYGGSSIITIMAGMGLLFNVGLRRLQVE